MNLNSKTRTKFFFSILTLFFITNNLVAQYSFIDKRDGKTYKTVFIEKSRWMAENLNVDRFCNGDSIPEAKTWEDWKLYSDDKQPAWCYYNFDPKNGPKYGKLYNGYAVIDPRGLAPAGWAIPHDGHWNQLTYSLNALSSSDSLTIDAKLCAKKGWNKYVPGPSTTKKSKKPESSKNGTNSSGFSALPGGIIDACKEIKCGFYGQGLMASWWCSNLEGIQGLLKYRTIDENNTIKDSMYNLGDLSTGRAVRCIEQ